MFEFIILGIIVLAVIALVVLFVRPEHQEEDEELVRLKEKQERELLARLELHSRLEGKFDGEATEILAAEAVSLTNLAAPAAGAPAAPTPADRLNAVIAGITMPGSNVILVISEARMRFDSVLEADLENLLDRQKRQRNRTEDARRQQHQHRRRHILPRRARQYWD